MRILKRIELIDLAIYTNKTLILTDFHIGYEEALNKQGVMVPRFQFPEIVKRLEAIFSKLKDKKIKRIIINGDLKHEFGTISEQEWRNVLKLLDYFGRHCDEIILIKGNHDTIIGPIAGKRGVKVLEHYVIDSGKELLRNEEHHQFASQINKDIKSASRGMPPAGMNADNSKNIKLWRADGAPSVSESFTTTRKNIKKNSINNTQQSFKTIKAIENHKTNSKNKILVIHGDKIPDKELLKGVSTIIIGHEHPAVSIRDGARTELFKAYLIGKWQGRYIIAQPSFNLVTEGTDMVKEQVLSPFLKGNLGKFEAIIAADKLYRFGKLKNLG